MKSKFIKFTTLFLALLLPVCIFLFLKMFGSNEFNIPIYYQTQVELDSTGCDGLVAPYRIQSITVLDKESIKALNFVGETTVVFVAADSGISKELQHQLNRVQDRLPKGMVELMIIGRELVKAHGWESYTVDESTLLNWSRCGLMSKNENEFVLIDENRNIRGYYNVEDIDEVDRLVVEVKILNSKL